MLRLLEELTPFERLALVDSSYSRLNTYKTCPAQYFYTYVTKERRTFGAKATLGNIVHGVMEKADLNNFDLDAMLDEFEVQWEMRDPEKIIPDDLIELGRLLITEFVDRHEGDTFFDVGRELNFEVVIGGGLYRGYIDRVDHPEDNSILLVDYKTGKHQETQKWAHQNLQLGLYALIAHHLWPERWPIRGELYYMRTAKIIHHTYTLEDLAWHENEITRLTKEIIEMNNFAYTTTPHTCRYLCDFGKSGVCKRGWAVLNGY